MELTAIRNRTPCDSRCSSAQPSSKLCKCSCGGENHAKKFGVVYDRIVSPTGETLRERVPLIQKPSEKTHTILGHCFLIFVVLICFLISFQAGVISAAVYWAILRIEGVIPNATKRRGPAPRKARRNP